MSKIKFKNEETEVLVARSKLDGVLQTLVDQKEDEASPEKESPGNNDAESDFFDSPINSPAKKSPRVNRLHRKRKLIKEETHSDYFSNTYLMKLFDRTVDLAAFTDDTPLYPVCRAWIRNLQPAHQPKEKPSIENDTCSSQLVTELPGPIVVKKEGEYHTNIPVIPSPVKRSTEPFYINQDSSSMEETFLKHMTRWKKVKQKWKEASRQQEANYIESYKVLKEMYDQQNFEE